jgi:hydrogenase maturation protease
VGYPRNSDTEGALRVIGVGNILLCDEGIGVHVVRELSRRGELPGVEFLDGGVAGATLLHLVEGEERVVLVDAADAPFPPGTVLRMTPDEVAGSGVPAWSLHDLNLADTLGMMRLRETLPEMIVLGVVPADIGTYSLDLSAPLAARFGEIVEKVRSEIAAFAASPRP